MSEFDKFRELIRALRAETGCPWDRKQTIETLAPHIIEEATEVVEAIKSGVDDEISEELGDVLLVVFMIAQVAEEAGRFSIDDSLRSIIEKVIRRHPHVFGDAKFTTPEEVIDSWRRIKEEEKRRKAGKSK
jgi:tetrapyrrole methylase family protein / MazG family protein